MKLFKKILWALPFISLVIILVFIMVGLTSILPFKDDIIACVNFTGGAIFGGIAWIIYNAIILKED